jgi:hypothetical protein
VKTVIVVNVSQQEDERDGENLARPEQIGDLRGAEQHELR